MPSEKIIRCIFCANVLGLILLGDLGSAQTRFEVAQNQTQAPADTAPSEPTSAPTSPPPDEGDPNVTPERQAFDRLLVDAALLRNQHEESKKRGKSNLKVSLSALRSLELRLQAVVDADRSNTQAAEMRDAVRLAQAEILGPSIAVAAIASRQLFADELGRGLGESGVKVTTDGRQNEVLLLLSPSMSRKVALQLNEKIKIFERATMLQFRAVVFRDGSRRGRWSYDVRRDRFR